MLRDCHSRAVSTTSQFVHAFYIIMDANITVRNTVRREKQVNPGSYLHILYIFYRLSWSLMFFYSVCLVAKPMKTLGSLNCVCMYFNRHICTLKVSPFHESPHVTSMTNSKWRWHLKVWWSGALMISKACLLALPFFRYVILIILNSLELGVFMYKIVMIK